MTQQIVRDFALPSPTEPNTLYLIAREENPSLPLSAYVTDKTNQLRTLFSVDIVNNVVQQAVQDGVKGRPLSFIVANLTERDVLQPADNAVVLVHENSYLPIDKPQGRMFYFYAHATKEWFSIASGSNAVVSWETISGKPASPASHIDDAVAKRHDHSNKGVLDRFGENEKGQATYNDKLLANVRLTTADF